MGGHIRFLKFNFASILLALFTSCGSRSFAGGCWMMAGATRAGRDQRCGGSRLRRGSSDGGRGKRP